MIRIGPWFGSIARAAVPACVAALIVLRAGLPVEAHGKEVEVRLTCPAADAAEPLTRRCQALVSYTTDGDPVSDARLTLNAVRSGKGTGEISGVPLLPSGQLGRYTATLTLPAYGTWTIAAQLAAPAEGRIQIEEAILPPFGPSIPAQDARVRLVVGFGVRDALNIVMLAAHLVGTIGLFAANSAVFVAGFLRVSDPGYRKRIAHIFPRAAGGSFIVLGASGIYNAVYNAPTRAPGLVHPGMIAGLPFGSAYLIAFAAKMVLVVVLFAGTILLAARLRHGLLWRLPRASRGLETAFIHGAAGPAAPPVRWDVSVALAATNLLTGAALLLTAAAASYLHLLTHAGAFLQR